VLGRAVLGIGDIYFNLGGGQVQLIKAKGCGKDWMPFWMAQMPGVTSLKLAETSERGEMIGSVFINGIELRALFDTGATHSTLTMAAAAKLGFHPGDPGVVSGGEAHGIGDRKIHSWIAKVDSFKIGDEEIRHTRMRFGEIDSLGTDMIVGADFFRSHQIYAALGSHRLIFAYRSGPVFDLTPLTALPEPKGN